MFVSCPPAPYRQYSSQPPRPISLPPSCPSCWFILHTCLAQMLETLVHAMLHRSAPFPRSSSLTPPAVHTHAFGAFVEFFSPSSLLHTNPNPNPNPSSISQPPDVLFPSLWVVLVYSGVCMSLVHCCCPCQKHRFSPRLCPCPALFVDPLAFLYRMYDISLLSTNLLLSMLEAPFPRLCPYPLVLRFSLTPTPHAPSWPVQPRVRVRELLDDGPVG